MLQLLASVRNLAQLDHVLWRNPMTCAMSLRLTADVLQISGALFVRAGFHWVIT